MKKSLLFLCMSAMLAFTSCGGDDNNSDEPQVPAQAVSGVYNGYSLMSSAYFQDQLSANDKITVTASGEKVNVTLDSEEFTSATVTGATVTKAGDTYTITGSGTAEMGMGGNVQTYNCTMSGTITSAGKADVTFTLPAVMGGSNIVFHTGTAPVQPEE